MTDLTDEEKRVLKALSELEPATIEEIALRAGFSVRRVSELLENLRMKGMLGSVDRPKQDEGDMSPNHS